MQTSSNIGEVSKALLSAKKFFKPLRRNKLNPHFKSKYADLDACLSVTQKALEAQGLVVIQGASMASPTQVAVTTRLVHAPSGEWIEEVTVLPVGAAATPQSVGAAITYGRRYGYSAITGITPDDDDDAERSVRPPSPAQPTQGTAQRIASSVPPRPAVAPAAPPKPQ